MRTLTLTSFIFVLSWCAPSNAHQHNSDVTDGGHYCDGVDRSELKKKAFFGEMALCMSAKQILRAARTDNYEVHYSIDDGLLQQVIEFGVYDPGQTYRFVLLKQGRAVNLTNKSKVAVHWH